MSGTVQEREAGLGRLDQERAASLADEGGASAIEFEARHGLRHRARERPKVSVWMAGIVIGFLAAAAMARRRRPGVP
jgi:hypothetical protein